MIERQSTNEFMSAVDGWDHVYEALKTPEIQAAWPVASHPNVLPWQVGLIQCLLYPVGPGWPGTFSGGEKNFLPSRTPLSLIEWTQVSFIAGRFFTVWTTREDPLEQGIATHSGILAWKMPWTEEPGRLQSMDSQRVGHDWTTNTFILFTLSLIGRFYQSCLGHCGEMEQMGHVEARPLGTESSSAHH